MYDLNKLTWVNGRALAPFDLDKAKGGHAVRCRDGTELTFGGYNPKACEASSIFGWRNNGTVSTWRANGNYSASAPNSWDLLMDVTDDEVAPGLTYGQLGEGYRLLTEEEKALKPTKLCEVWWARAWQPATGVRASSDLAYRVPLNTPPITAPKPAATPWTVEDVVAWKFPLWVRIKGNGRAYLFTSSQSEETFNTFVAEREFYHHPSGTWRPCTKEALTI